MPYLSYQIDMYNSENAEDDTVFKPNLKGFMVGNGVANYDYDCTPAYIDMAYWHSLYSQELRDKIVAANCDFTGVNPLSNASDECKEYYSEFSSLTSDVNVYDIFGICYGPDPHPQMYKAGAERGYTSVDYTPFLYEGVEILGGLPPCTFGTPILAYYGRDDVRAALHIPDEANEWDLCSTKVTLEYHRGA